MDRYEFGDVTLRQERPDGFELRAIRQPFADFHARVGIGVWSLGDQLSVLESGNYLPFHNTAFDQPFGSVFSYNLSFFVHELANRIEQLPHR